MKLLVVGFGFIARDVVKAFHEKAPIMKKVDEDFKIIGVSNSKGYVYNKEGLNIGKLLSAKNLSNCSGSYHAGGSSVELIEKSGADLMVEATPTRIEDGEPGLTFIRRALSAGIHVVTPNKGPLVIAFRELTALAEKNGCELLYEGTVAGAVPIFSLARGCLQGDRVLRISGILNGTTNYILSKMHFEETSFELALKEAQERGFTERNPSYDVDGIDAACKVVILANALMNRDVKFEDVERVGVRGVTQEAVSLAKKSNFAIKLVGTVDSSLEVTPKLVPTNHPLCVHGTLNAVHLETDLAKEITLVGYGAGKETVSAVLNDVLTILKKRKSCRS
ncbi:MAG: homoserine dehydrogenase [Candidatus Bathyarchaeota archaeon]|nr:homoserine dehydrogenase [Candidatus Bathyarchaeota archaeon]